MALSDSAGRVSKNVYFISRTEMYLIDPFLFDPSKIGNIFINLAEAAWIYHKNYTIVLVLLWVVLTAVKFSYLFLFRKLSERLRPTVIY